MAVCVCCFTVASSQAGRLPAFLIAFDLVILREYLHFCYVVAHGMLTKISQPLLIEDLTARRERNG